MASSQYITVAECCSLLQISRPTFLEKRQSVTLHEQKRGRYTLFKKQEILDKLYTPAFEVQATVNLIFLHPNFDLNNIIVDQHTIDLRKVGLLDPYGVISLICYVTAKLKSGENIFFITSKSKITMYLVIVGFFKELQRQFPELCHWNEDLINDLEASSKGAENIFLPLKEITRRGQEREVLNEAMKSLLEKGFPESQAGYIGWIIGELADNALTHARGPCYIMFSRYRSQKGIPFLEITVGDTGVGIHTSLKSNSKYSQLTDKQAFLKAFQSQVSSWPDEAKRGKGLCDILVIALGNQGYVRSDANNLGLLFNFTSGQRNVEFNKPIAAVDGTRFSIILFEKDFASATREEVDSFLLREIEKI